MLIIVSYLSQINKATAKVLMTQLRSELIVDVEYDTTTKFMFNFY